MFSEVIESPQCAFCCKSAEESELIDMSTNSIVIFDEIFEFFDVIRNVLNCQLHEDHNAFICEDCKNQLIQFQIFKENAKKSSLLTSAVDENIEKVKLFLEESEDESVFCMRYNKCLTLVPESKRSFMEIFKHWQPHVILEKLDEVMSQELADPIRIVKHENVGEENQARAVVLENERLEDFDLEDPQDEWIQADICSSEIVDPDEAGESYLCKHCEPNERFYDGKEFRSHLSSHEDYEHIFVDPHETESDDAEIAKQETVVESITETLNQFECSKCEFKSSDCNELRIHQKSHVDQTIFHNSRFERLFCADCCFQFVSQAHYLAHINGHKLYAIVAKYSSFPVCEMCNTMFSDETFAHDHQRNHELGLATEQLIASEGFFLKFGHHRPEMESEECLKNDNDLKCGHCLKFFLDDESCRLHQLIFHVKTLKCPIESRVFKGNQAFSIHMRNNHPELFGEEVKFKCSVCKQKFETLYEKLGHMKTCDKKRFQCTHCDKKFSQKCYLMTHLKQVSGQTSITCEICEKVCRDKGDYQIHYRSHSNVKPFPCSICPKAYKTSSARAAHLETHIEEGFLCEFCHIKFRSRRTLQKHVKTKHSDVVKSKEKSSVMEVDTS